MQTTASLRKPRARTLTADSPLPYPSAPTFDASNLRQWLAWWMREQAMAEELKRLRFSGPDVKADAMYFGHLALKKQADDSLENLVRAGGLLFAWAGTTRLQAAA